MKNGAFNAGGEAYDRIFKALGDPHRIRIIELLKEKELSAGEILDTIDIVQSTLSHHMKTLSDSGAVNAVRRGKWTYYSLNESNLASASAYLALCAEGTRVRWTGQESQADDSLSGQRTSRKPSEAAGRSSVKTASKSAAKETALSSGKPAAKRVAKEPEQNTVKPASKSADRVSGQDTGKTAVKAADKSGKKKDKKGKKSKKNKK